VEKARLVADEEGEDGEAGGEGVAAKEADVRVAAERVQRFLRVDRLTFLVWGGG
jgi:hypothetical protein